MDRAFGPSTTAPVFSRQSWRILELSPRTARGPAGARRTGRSPTMRRTTPAACWTTATSWRTSASTCTPTRPTPCSGLSAGQHLVQCLLRHVFTSVFPILIIWRALVYSGEDSECEWPVHWPDSPIPAFEGLVLAKLYIYTVSTHFSPMDRFFHAILITIIFGS